METNAQKRAYSKFHIHSRHRQTPEHKYGKRIRSKYLESHKNYSLKYSNIEIVKATLY